MGDPKFLQKKHITKNDICNYMLSEIESYNRPIHQSTSHHTRHYNSDDMDDPVAVVVSWKVIKCCFQCFCGLVKCFVANSMHFYLKAGPVGLFAEISDLIIRVVEHTISAYFIDIGFVHGCVMRAETAVQGTLKTSAYSGEIPRRGYLYIKRLRKYPDLIAVLDAFGKPFLQVDIHVKREAYSADSMDHPYERCQETLWCI